MTFTPTQQKILGVLSDGQGHTKRELLDVLDPYMNPDVLAVHICLLRKKLKLRNENILSVATGDHRRYVYIHVRLISPAEAG